MVWLCVKTSFPSSFCVFVSQKKKKKIKCFCKAKLQNLKEREKKMSVFREDSWGREAQHRKRRLDDLLLEELVDGSSYKKLSNGKYACLVCSDSPILDSPLILSVRTFLSILNFHLYHHHYMLYYLLVFFLGS